MSDTTRVQELEQFVREVADLPDVPASRRIIEHDPAGMLQTLIEQAKELRGRLTQ